MREATRLLTTVAVFLPIMATALSGCSGPGGAAGGPRQITPPAPTDGLEAPTTSQVSADGAAVTGLTPVEAREIAAAAATDPWTLGKLQSASTRLVEVYAAADGKGPVAVRFIDYDTMARFTVFVDLASGRVEGHEVDSDWPNFSPDEIERASTIAMSDAEVIARASGGPLVVNNTTGGTGQGACAERRCIAVFLTPPDGDYAALIIAVVDLGLEEVVGFAR